LLLKFQVDRARSPFGRFCCKSRLQRIGRLGLSL